MIDKIYCLVVDDNSSSARLIAEYLEEYPNVEAQTKIKSEEALQCLKEKSFNLLFTDFDMYPYNGRDMIAALESNGTGKAFLMTGSTITAEQINSAVLLDILYKPVIEEQFKKAMEMCFSSR